MPLVKDLARLKESKPLGPPFPMPLVKDLARLNEAKPLRTVPRHINNRYINSSKMTETGFSEQFNFCMASYRMGSAQILLKISG